jgi:hypothetical protein
LVAKFIKGAVLPIGEGFEKTHIGVEENHRVAITGEP